MKCTLTIDGNRARIDNLLVEIESAAAVHLKELWQEVYITINFDRSLTPIGKAYIFHGPDGNLYAHLFFSSKYECANLQFGFPALSLVYRTKMIGNELIKYNGIVDELSICSSNNQDSKIRSIIEQVKVNVNL
jgi:hypothetical protein